MNAKGLKTFGIIALPAILLAGCAQVTADESAILEDIRATANEARDASQEAAAEARQAREAAEAAQRNSERSQAAAERAAEEARQAEERAARMFERGVQK